MSIDLESLEATARLGCVLAGAVTARNPGTLLLYGALGAGKTTLVRAFVEALPGGAEAEVASPSFTICNIYCTAPRVYHFDLYRLDSGCSDEALEESLDDPTVLTVVEWPERIAPALLPQDGLVCTLTAGGASDARRAEISALGPAAAACLEVISAPPSLPLDRRQP